MKLPPDKKNELLPRLTIEQFIRLDDGFCPICSEQLPGDRSKRCNHCGNGPFDGEVELDLNA